jgi:hypothetical protein
MPAGHPGNREDGEEQAGQLLVDGDLRHQRWSVAEDRQPPGVFPGHARSSWWWTQQPGVIAAGRGACRPRPRERDSNEHRQPPGKASAPGHRDR